MIEMFLPFQVGVFVVVGYPGSFHFEGYHTGVDAFAEDYNRSDSRGNLIEDLDLPLLAVADGVISSNYGTAATGYGIILDVGSGYTVRYHHLRIKSPLPPGHQVKRGDEVGRLGSTGYSTGPHLHFVVYHNGVSVVPEFVGVPTKYSGMVIEVKEVKPVEKSEDEKLEETYQANPGLGSKLYKARSEDGTTVYLICEKGVIELNNVVFGTTWVRALGAEWGEAKIASGEIVRL